MTNICTKVTVRKRPIKNGQLSLYLDFTLLSDTRRPANRQGGSISAYTYMPTRQRSLKRSSTRPCSAMRNSSSAGEPKPSSTRSSAFLTGTGVRRASWNTSNPKWRTMTISEIGIPPTSILKSTVVEAALLMI